MYAMVYRPLSSLSPPVPFSSSISLATVPEPLHCAAIPGKLKEVERDIEESTSVIVEPFKPSLYEAPGLVLCLQPKMPVLHAPIPQRVQVPNV